MRLLTLHSFIPYKLLFSTLLILAAARSHAQSKQENKKLAKEIEDVLIRDLLQPFYPRSIDKDKGGFFTSFTFDWKPGIQEDKMIVTQSRHTWLPSKAAELYPDNKSLKEAARHGFLFLRDKMWDKINGGFYQQVSMAGIPHTEQLKTSYGNAFGLFAVCAYFQTSRDSSALNLAKKAFTWLEENGHDPLNKGYFQTLTSKGKPVSSNHLESKFLYKDQNSSIHLLEALTELYKIWPDRKVKERIEEIFILIRDTITNSKGYLTLYFTKDWRPVSYLDSGENLRNRYVELDHISFGHDVETAFLLIEAAHTLGKVDRETSIKAKKMVDHALLFGWDSLKGGFYEKGYYFKEGDKPKIIDDRKNWWAQLEGLNTLLLMVELYPNDKMRYREKFEKQWEYIKQYLLDKEYKGIYEWGQDKSPQTKHSYKAHSWKAAYHEGRALMNILKKLNKR